MHRLERIRKKGLALLLSIIMMVGLLPLSAIAETEPVDPDSAAEASEQPEVTPSEQPAETPEPEETPAETPEPEETPAETPEPEETPEPTAEPEETPAPEYLFERETVLLTEILDAVGKKITENAELSVDSDKVRLSETKIETQDPEKRNLDGVTVTVTATFDFATLTVRTEHDEMTITMGYPVRKPIAIAYTFAKRGDSFSVRALLSENGVEGALDGITVREGDGEALAILERDGDCFVGAIDAFDRIVLRVNIDGGRPVDLTLQMAGPAGDDPAAPIEPDDMLRVRDGVTFFGVTDKAHVSATAEPVEASVKNGTVLAAYELRMIPDEPTKRDLRTWQDAPVEVHLSSESFGNRRLTVYRIDESGEAEAIAEVTAENGEISFAATQGGVYAVAALDAFITASDGNTYRITAEYEAAAGIPTEGTALSVREITEDDPDYAFYMEESMKAADTDRDHLAFARAFDIKIVDAEDPAHVYEPQGEVRVAVTLVDSKLADLADVNVVHFADAETVRTIDAPDVDGDTVTFITDHFSVYVVNGTVHTRTFYFYTLNEYLEYEQYWLNTDTENPAYMQIVREGEMPVAPQDPINPQDQEATFAGWYRGGANPADPQLWATPYDFSAPLELREDDVVYLYAKFTHYVYVIFHDEYDENSDSFPIAFTRRLDLLSDNEEDWYVDVEQYTVSYKDPEHQDNTEMAFVGWSDTPIKTPGAALDDYGGPVEQVVTDNGRLSVTETTHLYPIYAPVRWLSFYSGPSGSRATFFTDKYYLNGVGPDSLPGTDVMSRNGYWDFEGWYINATVDPDTGEVDTVGATKIANADGSLILGAGSAALGIQVVQIDGVTRLRLTNSSAVTLYANWTVRTTSHYTVIVRREKATDTPDMTDAQKSYEYAERFVINGPISDELILLTDLPSELESLNTLAGYNAMHPDAPLSSDDDNPYSGYRFNLNATRINNAPDTYVDPETGNTIAYVTIREDGSDTILICYDWTGWGDPSDPDYPVRPPKYGQYYALTFVDSMDPTYVFEAYQEEDAFDNRIEYGASLAMFRPSPDPISPISEEGLKFKGWYADETCNTRVYFSAAAFNSATDRSKVLYETMPGTDLVLYAGWEKQWFLIQIDPNYGELYKKTGNTLTGTGSTWMWKEYGDTFQEYVTTRRDYVESDSGSWYYVKKDRNYYGYLDPNDPNYDPNAPESRDRQTYYTQSLTEATEFTTFAYDPGVYRYAGWYEVLFDSNGNEIGESETRYDFEHIVDHNITLRLRWMKLGAFYIEYDAGEGTMNREDENETLFVALDGAEYGDDAIVTVTRVANPPEGYEFVGWTVRGDESGTIYRIGQSFHIRSEFAATVQGKRTVFLDAVYTRVPTVTMVYHFNGGSLTAGETVDFGHPVDTTASYSTISDSTSATVSGLANNAEFVLSSLYTNAGDTVPWLSRADATFVGWCENEIFDPSDEDHPLLTPGGTYRVGLNEGETAEEQTVHLYAIWGVEVRYHLNKSISEANFGGDWSTQLDQNNAPIYVLNAAGDTYTQSGVHIDSVLGWPPHDPATDVANTSFCGWATRTEENGSYTYTNYDFSQPVTGALDLYALWGVANTLNVKVVDSTHYPTIDVAPWVDGDSDGTADGDATIPLTAEPKTPRQLAEDAGLTADAQAFDPDYGCAFATVADHLAQIGDIQENPIEYIYYSPRDGKVHLVYGAQYNAVYGTTGERDEVLDTANKTLYIVYYKVKKPAIGYLLMEENGDVSPILNMDPAAPTSTTQLTDEHGSLVTISPNAVFAIRSSYQPMSWLQNPVIAGGNSIPKENIRCYNFSIGDPNATNANQLYHKTQAYTGYETGADARPDLYIKNTWKGICFSQDGTSWFNAGSNSQLYVVYFTEQPTIITVYNQTVGLVMDMDQRFTYDYWIELIDLTANPETATLIYTTRANNESKMLAAGETFSAFTTTGSTHTYRVTFVVKPEDDFTVTMPSAVLTGGGSVASSAEIVRPDWVGDSSRAGYYSTNADIGYAFSYIVREGDGCCGKTALIPFINTRSSVNVDLHIARADTTGIMYHTPEWRVAAADSTNTIENPANAYTVSVPLGQTVNLFNGYTYDIIAPNYDRDYVPGALVYGSDHHTSALHENNNPSENDEIMLDENAPLSCYRIAYEQVNPSNPNVYDLYIKDERENYRYPLSELSYQIALNINGITHPNDGELFYRLFYLFYPAITVYYVFENSDGSLTQIQGNAAGDITYDGAVLHVNGYDGMQATLNSETVIQGQKVGIWEENLNICQVVGRDENGNPYFNIPPLLDLWDSANSVSRNLDLVYYKLGARAQADNTVVAGNISDFPGNKNNGFINPETGEMYADGVTETLDLNIGIVDHRLQWQFADEPHFLRLSGWPVIYAIYRERGYSLTVSKTVPVDTGYNEPFTVTVESAAINRDTYPVTGTGYTQISAIPAQLDSNDQLIAGTGLITFDVKDGDSVTIVGLAPGDYTVTETGSENFELTAQKTVGENATPEDATVTDGAVAFSLEANTEIDLVNTPVYICKIGNRKFHTLTAAIDYIIAYSADFTETIEMLVPEYLMPQSDTPEIPSYLHVTLTTAQPDSEDPDNQIASGQTAKILRKSNVTRPMLNNLGELTLTDIELDGNSGVGTGTVSTFSVPMINNEGTLHVDSGAALHNAATAGDGAAIYSYKGTIDVAGGEIYDCSAARGGAIYAASGTVSVSDGALYDNAATEGGAIYYAGSDALTVSGGAIGADGHANTAQRGAAIYMASGTANLSGGTVSYNEASESGGAVYALNAYVNVSGGTLSYNAAATDGGAVHMETLTLTVSSGSLDHNRAANGGGVWADTGSVVLSGGQINDNTATTGSGGGVYTQSSAFRMTKGEVSRNTAYLHGGGVFSESGTVTFIGESQSRISQNTAQNGNGGGVYAGTGAITMSNIDENGVTQGAPMLTGNSAAAGNGGAIYAGTGAVSLTGSTVGKSNNVNNANRAVNGSAVFVYSGALSVTDGMIKGNIATNGGAIGFGSADARLNLYNGVQITENTMNGAASNVYLNFDTDAIINFQTLSSSANVGIYVSDDPVTVDGESTTVLEQRGVPNARFGVYVNNNVTSNRGKIHNDRTENLTVGYEATNKKLYWIRDFSVKIYYVADYTRGLPFGGPDYTNNFSTSSGSNGGQFKKQVNETPPEYHLPVVDVAADLRTKSGVNLSSTSVFGSAFVQGSSVGAMHYTDYLTDINWNTDDNLWEFVKRDGTNVAGGSNPNAKKTLIFIYTEPYYLSIENNAKDGNSLGLTLVIDGLTVTVNGTAESVVNNYGYLYAKNDEIQDDLRPVQASDLVLGYGESVRILLPGGKGMDYALTGTYYSVYDPEDPANNAVASGSVDFRQRVTTESNLATGTVNAAAVSVSGGQAKTPSVSGQTHELIFGGDKAICRVVVDAQIIQDDGPVSTGFVDAHAGEGATAGRYEYTFSSPKQANAFIMAHHAAFTSGSTVTAAIEMLMDYMMPASEQVSMTTGRGYTYSITFRTATDGYFRFDPDNTRADGSGTHPRAKVSRASGNLGSFITAPAGTLTNGDYVDTLTVENLIFDGKSFGGNNIERGIIDTNGWNVEIDTVDFNNCQARYGGGVFIKSVTPKSGSQTPYGHLTVRNSTFYNCQSLEKDTDKYGGGGIWTSMKTLTVEDCSFITCFCERQGGGLFHFVCTTGDYESYTNIDGCTFEGCSAGQAAGSMESGARVVRVSNTVFRNSTSNAKNGGALNIWSGNSDSTSGKPTTNSWVYLTGCTFENCYALNGTGSNGNGGAMRSTAKYNTITGCTFTNNIGNDGGAINIFNTNAEETFLSGCTFNGCSARNSGGAIYCASKKLTIDAVDHTAATPVSTENHTTIRNCIAPNNGGAVYHGSKVNGSTFTMADAMIDTCTTTTGAGGAVFTTALTVSLTDSTVENCSAANPDAARNGGGLYLGNSTNTTISGTAIQNCTASGVGGGVYHAAKGTFTVSDDSLISGNTAKATETVTCNNVTYQISGGGIYTKALTFVLENSSVTDNHGIGSGGGICQNYDNADNGSMILDGATVTGNISGGCGGGIFTLTNLTMRGVTAVTGNRLTTDSETAENAAGIYLRDGVNLTVGSAGGNQTSNVLTVTGNLTVDGIASDLRLPETGAADADGKRVNDNRVLVVSGIGGEVRVVNAWKKLTRFGTAQGSLSNPAGFTDEFKVFWSEDSSLYGIVDRQNDSGKNIIWGGDPICKITDANGRLLYIDADHIRPAVFDRLDAGYAVGSNSTLDTSTTSAFSTLRRLDDGVTTLYYADGTPYTGTAYQVKMLIEEYTTEYFITATGGTDRTITLTTAKSSDSLYPYRGRTGTRCTILRSTNMNTGKSLVTAKTNLTLTNIVLDGGSENGVTATANTRVITANYGSAAAIRITLGRNAALQNAEINGNGGGVYLDNGAQLHVVGGAIRNCSAVNGGGVYINGVAGTMNMSVGTITKCTASGNGGGVYFNNGKQTLDETGNPISGFIRISGGSISRCSAVDGGGVYLNGGNGQNITRQMYMAGGSISGNNVTGVAGGIYVGDEKVRIYFSGAPYVYRNTSESADLPNSEAVPSYTNASNVQMDKNFTRDADNPNTVIVSRGLIRGATVGVYVPGEDNNNNTTSFYDKYGAEMDPFATFDGNDRGLNYFVNDRNGMKGGKIEDQNATDRKIYWRIIYALSVTKHVLSDDPADNSKSFRFTVQLTGMIPGSGEAPDMRAEDINGRYGDLTFTNGHTSFVLMNGETKTADLLPLGFGYEITESFTSTNDRLRFKTSVENWDGTVTQGTTVTGTMEEPAHFSYAVTFSNLHAICKITDDLGRLLYTQTSTGDYLPAVYSVLVNAFNMVNAGTDIEWFYKDETDSFERSYPNACNIEMLVPDYEMEEPAGVLRGQKAVLTTASADADDGFPYVGGSDAAVIKRAYDGASMLTVDNGELTLGRITLDGARADGYTATQNGGAVQVKENGTLTVGTGATIRNATTERNGAGIYLAEGSTMNLSGAPVFRNNMVAYTNVSDLNGSETSYTGGTARQDIYIAGYGSADAASLVITGDIESAAGSIWVWAEAARHYQQSKQFAVMRGGTHSGLDAFRNARPDSETNNPFADDDPPMYLTGTARGSKVYWTGSMDLTVTKVVEGDFSDVTDRFDFTVSGLENGDICSVERYVTVDGTTWTADGAPGTLTANASGVLSFSLAHYEKIVVSIPSGTQVTLTETSHGYYHPSYVLDSNASVDGAAVTVTMDDDRTVAFTNTYNAVSPSGLSFRVVPFLIILSMSALMVPALIIGRRKRREEE